MRWVPFVAAVGMTACVASANGTRGPGTDSDSGNTGNPDSGDSGSADSGTDCELGLDCNPIPITSFPYTEQRDTTQAPGATWSGYACAPEVNEGGGEWLYKVTVTQAGILSAAVSDGDDVDVDIHLLTGPSPADCLVRDDQGTGWWVEPGEVWLAVDTWVDGSGDDQPGAYELEVRFHPTGGGTCGMDRLDQMMVWKDCAPGIDCYEADDGDGVEQRYLRMPAFGPVVLEAHLVTDADDFGGGWPTSFTDGIEAHYAHSEGVSGYDMNRDQPWAPAGEGGSEFGQGSSGGYVPVEAEAWYVCQYWKQKPAKGARLVVLNPFTGRAVIAAGGYETGPGANDAVGGATEEIHDWLETGHRDGLVMGFATDQSLPYGPIDCGW